jgi:hypothetical protein
MVLVCHQHDPQPRAPTRRFGSGLSDAAAGEALETIFMGAADWPSIDDALASRSLSMISAVGISAWFCRGGCMRPDGSLSFGACSTAASQIVHNLLHTSRGFHWIDDCGASWGVIPDRRSVEGGNLSGFAVSWGGAANLLDPCARSRDVRALQSRIERVRRPGRDWTAADRGAYSRWAHALHCLRLADIAMPLLLGFADARGPVEFDFGDFQWEALPAPSSTVRPTPDEVWDALIVASGLQLAELTLGCTGWDPRIIRQSAAINELARRSLEDFGFSVSPLWGKVVTILKADPRPHSRTGPAWSRLVPASPPL